MRPTLRSVLASPTLVRGRPEVLSGADRLDAPVRWVHVGEIRELAGVLQGGELILSTGLAMRGPVEESVSYISELVAAGVAGLVVELGDAFPRVPDEAVEAARRAGVPLVVLHSKVRFVDVTEEVHRLIVAEQLAQVEFAREVHEQFTRLSLEGADAVAIVASTAALCGSSVVLEDLARHVLAYTARGRPAAGLLSDWERRSRSAPATEVPQVAGPEGWVTAPVGRHGARWGRLVVPDPQTTQARLTMLLERAAQALELGRMVERDRLELELQAQGGLLADLAGGRIDDEQLAAVRARSLGLPPAPAYVAVVGRPPGAEGGDPVAAHDRSRTLVEQLSRAVRAAGLSGLVGELSGRQAGLLLGVRPRGETAALDAVAAALSDTGATLGVGPVAERLLAAGAGLRQAGHVAEVAAAMPASSPRKPYYRNSDVRLHGLVALLHDDPRMQAFVEAELSGLLAHEAQRRDGLLDLLRQYVATGGNKTRLAEVAHLSRPAVYHRLARLERVLGADLDDPASLMSLGVALLAYDGGLRR